MAVPSGPVSAWSHAANTFINGSSYVIAGSGFGTKTTAAPLNFDTGAGRTNGQSVTTGGWDIASGPTTPPIYSATQHRTCRDRSIQCRFQVPEYGSNFGIINVDQDGGTHTWPGTEYYLDFWNYLPDPEEYGGTVRCRNWKYFWSCGNAGGGPGLLLNTYPSSWSGDSHMYNGGLGGIESTWYGLWPSMMGNVWTHHQFWAKASTPNTADGTTWLHHQTTTYIDRVGSMQTRQSSILWKYLLFGEYYATDTGGQGGNNTYWSDVYVDVTPARVELGDNATYASCTHREIQPATTWATDGTSITITANKGTFAAGATYLHVTTSTGTHLTSIPVTVT